MIAPSLLREAFLDIFLPIPPLPITVFLFKFYVGYVLYT